MADLRVIIAQGRKRLGFLIGAGAPASLPGAGGSRPLIPPIAPLTENVLKELDPAFAPALGVMNAVTPKPNIEQILSRARALAGVIGDGEVHGLNGAGYQKLCDAICERIAAVVSVRLPTGGGPYRHLINWIRGADRDHPVELFTTNYDLLFEEAFEEVRAPLFDGFAGAREPFFDPVSVANNDLPPRWTRLWKLHGSLGWASNETGEVVRVGGDKAAAHLIYPEHIKYDQTRKAPYSALFDRLRGFLSTPDTLLIASGFSFADAHVSAVIDESLAANPATSVIAFQFNELARESYAAALGKKRPNFSVYAPDRAVISGVEGVWRPGDPLNKNWEAIRASYWNGSPARFLLGDFNHLARFFALSRSDQSLEEITREAGAA